MKRCVTIFHCSGPLYLIIWILVILLNLLEKLKLSSDSECPELWFYATYKMFHLKIKWSVKVNFSLHWATIYMHSCDLAEFIREAKNVLWFRMSRTVILCSLQNVSFENERVRESQFFTALNDYIYISLVILLSCIIAWPTSRKRCFFVCACFEFYLGVFLICSWLLLHLFKVIFTNCSASAGLTGHTIELLVVCVCVCVRACVRACAHAHACVCVCALYNKDEHADCWTSTSMRYNWFF